MNKPDLPDFRHVPMRELSVDDLIIRLSSRCDVCGKPRSVPGGHRKCAKIRQQHYLGK